MRSFTLHTGGVAGSIPASPTNNFNRLVTNRALAVLPGVAPGNTAAKKQTTRLGVSRPSRGCRRHEYTASRLLGNLEHGVAILSSGRDLSVGLLRFLKPFAVRVVFGLDSMNRL